MTSTTHRIAVHDWSLDRTLGLPRDAESDSPGALRLLDLPAQLRAHGYDTVQFCHFHLPTRDPAYLAELRGALAEHDVTLDALLIDDGDLTGPDAARDEAWIAAWIDDAGTLGATNARVIAGKTRTPDAQEVASRALGRLAQRDDVRVLTENWFDVTRDADDVRRILEPLDGAVGLLVDLANWTGPDKYAQLAAIAPYGETCHAKAHWHGATLDEADYRASLDAIHGAGYTGPLALVSEADDPDEWAGLDALRRVASAQPAAI